MNWSARERMQREGEKERERRATRSFHRMMCRTRGYSEGIMRGERRREMDGGVQVKRQEKTGFSRRDIQTGN